MVRFTPATELSEHTDPSSLAQQLNTHRAEMNNAILSAGGTVMQYVGDAVMAVFGAPEPSVDHADRALVAAHSMHAAQAAVNARWIGEGLEPFPLGIGSSTPWSATRSICASGFNSSPPTVRSSSATQRGTSSV